MCAVMSSVCTKNEPPDGPGVIINTIFCLGRIGICVLAYKLLDINEKIGDSRKIFRYLALVSTYPYHYWVIRLRTIIHKRNIHSVFISARAFTS